MGILLHNLQYFLDLMCSILNILNNHFYSQYIKLNYHLIQSQMLLKDIQVNIPLYIDNKVYIQNHLLNNNFIYMLYILFLIYIQNKLNYILYTHYMLLGIILVDKIFYRIYLPYQNFQYKLNILKLKDHYKFYSFHGIFRNFYLFH